MKSEGESAIYFLEEEELTYCNGCPFIGDYDHGLTLKVCELAPDFKMGHSFQPGEKMRNINTVRIPPLCPNNYKTTKQI